MANNLTAARINAARILEEGIEKERVLDPAQLSSNYTDTTAIKVWMNKKVSSLRNSCFNSDARSLFDSWIKESNDQPSSIIAKIISVAATTNKPQYTITQFPIYIDPKKTIFLILANSHGKMAQAKQFLSDALLDEENDRIESGEPIEAVQADYTDKVIPVIKPVIETFDPAKDVLQKLEELHPENLKLDDIGLSDLFIELYGHVCRFCSTTGKWMSYDGKRWIEEEKTSTIAKKYLKDFQRKLSTYGSLRIDDDDKRNAFLKIIGSYGSNNKLNNLLSCAESRDPVQFDQFDKNPDLFNCQNGTYNLRTGVFKPHDYRDYLTRISNVTYDENASSDLWEDTVDTILDGNKELIEYLQRMFGYSLTDDSSLENFFIFWGSTTRNGKSTILETIFHMFGSYAETIDSATLAYKQVNGSSPTPDIYKLKGTRLVVVREPEPGLTLATSLIKIVTGRDTISSRTLHSGNYIKFIPSFKIFFNTNWKPVINDVTLFTSNRVRLIPFNHHFEIAEQDKSLKDRLRQPDVMSAVFNWCVQGYRNFLYIGENEPEEIKNLVKEYDKEQDRIYRFIEDCMIQDEKNSSSIRSAYDAYSSWCLSEKVQGVGLRRFAEELRARNLIRDGHINGVHYKEVVYHLVLKQ